ncbi:hypothetical protein [Kutzneria sp. 744]|uniref:hypothetical protein n=1 Tax=Kutzneria sp. (strain 744) TaxID=345341 RepID=UPI0004AD3A9A|nr:hypothetical protein [Kutzneria sp. 744]
MRITAGCAVRPMWTVVVALAYVTAPFDVPAGSDRLDADIGIPAPARRPST